jgi:tetratricopeptide (TPR) repeat protein
MCPHKPVTFVSGQWHEIRSWEKRQLANRVEQGADSNAIFTRLVEINRSIALRNPAVSSTCFTTFVDHLGTSTGRANGESGTVGVPLSAFPSLLRDLVNDGVIKPIKGQSLRIIQTSVTRVTASEEYHKAQVVHCPGNADAYSNYGAYLFASSGDIERAEELYLKALSINPFHTNALANLALLRWRGQLYDEAERLFQIALTRRDETGNAEAGVENVCWGYSHFLASEKDNLVAALTTADCGIRDFPHSSRLVAWRAHLLLLQRRAAEALSEFQRARELGATASETEPGYAIALQLSGASRSECLAAYQGARKIAPANTAVLLNLAQLLFAEGDATQASRYLRDALNLQLDFSAEMEAQFYLLAHTTVESGGVFRRLKELLAHGARMDWDVSPNIEAVSRSCPQKAACLAEISLILRGLQGQESLTTLEARMKRM